MSLDITATTAAPAADLVNLVFQISSQTTLTNFWLLSEHQHARSSFVSFGIFASGAFPSAQLSLKRKCEF